MLARQPGCRITLRKESNHENGTFEAAGGSINPAPVHPWRGSARYRHRPSGARQGRGGTLKLGMGGGSTTDSLDPTLLVDWVSLNQAYMLMNGLVEINE